MSRTNFLFVAFLCVFAASNLKGIRNFAEAFSGNEVSSDIEKIDYDKVWASFYVNLDSIPAKKDIKTHTTQDKSLLVA